ncbi:hypothetical protein SDC9_129844 [bioreactor metagenome]|uniref:Uncharacterized protein n=1 Tax=bioreactor metagenome TaxID=1076179 RepID=A0A645D221_9ZZZZ
MGGEARCVLQRGGAGLWPACCCCGRGAPPRGAGFGTGLLRICGYAVRVLGDRLHDPDRRHLQCHRGGWGAGVHRPGRYRGRHWLHSGRDGVGVAGLWQCLRGCRAVLLRLHDGAGLLLHRRDQPGLSDAQRPLRVAAVSAAGGPDCVGALRMRTYQRSGLGAGRYRRGDHGLAQHRRHPVPAEARLAGAKGLRSAA